MNCSCPGSPQNPFPLMGEGRVGGKSPHQISPGFPPSRSKSLRLSVHFCSSLQQWTGGLFPCRPVYRDIGAECPVCWVARPSQLLIEYVECWRRSVPLSPLEDCRPRFGVFQIHSSRESIEC